MSSEFNNLNNIDLKKIPDASNFKFGIVVSKWNREITDNLLKGCIDLLKSKGALDININIIKVPGSFELIYGCKKMQQEDVNAIIAIGSVIRGETKHFDFICNATSNGIKDLNLSGNIPVIFCVLTDENMEQAIDRY
jgi:6,7-dimethyl-8-ribityllumazine synthase